MYQEDDMLMLSGIQHFRFCPRQWALIHLEQQWEDNRLTAEGDILHKHVDDPFYRQKYADCICLRSVSVASSLLGLYGITDIVELHPADDEANSMRHPQYQGCWLPYPVEYKHGRPKKDDIDTLQLAAQAMCLEEMYHLSIPRGAIYYAQIKRRVEIEFVPELRSNVETCSKAMHDIFHEAKIPPIAYGKHCERCSMNDICMPQSGNTAKASCYLKKNLYEKTS